MRALLPFAKCMGLASVLRRWQALLLWSMSVGRILKHFFDDDGMRRRGGVWAGRTEGVAGGGGRGGIASRVRVAVGWSPRLTRHSFVYSLPYHYVAPHRDTLNPIVDLRGALPEV